MKKNNLKIALSKIKFGFILVAGLSFFAVSCEKENLDPLLPTNATETQSQVKDINPPSSNNNMIGGGDNIFPTQEAVIAE